MYLNSRCGAGKEDEAIKLLKKASDMGLADAQTELGVFYTKSNDMENAAEFFSKAAAQNVSDFV